MNEYDLWTYAQAANSTGALYGIGLAIFIGLGFWISGTMYNSTDKNIIGKRQSIPPHHDANGIRP